MDDTAAAFSLLWDPQVMPRRGPRPTLTFESIAWAGIEIADREGLAGLTMHGVAQSLGVTKMALYRYVPGKAELVALMVDIGIGQPTFSDAVTDWRSELHRWSRDLFEQFRDHPWSLEATLGIRAIGPNELGWIESAVAALTGIGLKGGEVLDVAATLVGHVRNLAQQLTAMAVPDSAAANGTAADPGSAMVAWLTLLRHGRETQYPALVAALESATGEGAQNQALEFGLELILDGVEQLLATRSQSPA